PLFCSATPSPHQLVVEALLLHLGFLFLLGFSSLSSRPEWPGSFFRASSSAPGHAAEGPRQEFETCHPEPRAFCGVSDPLFFSPRISRHQSPHPKSAILLHVTMPPEIEIKLRLSNPKSFLRQLTKLGAKPISPRTHELNLLFDTPDGGLAKHGQLLRIRTETPAPAGKKPNPKKSSPRYLLTFKSPPEQLAISPHPPDRRHKVREELETTLTDAAPVKKIFEGLGLRGWFQYEKF